MLIKTSSPMAESLGSNFLLDPEVVKRHEATYGKGVNHLYPNENMVRLVSWFFSKGGRVLDYGFGPGENLIFLLKQGYEVSGVEVSWNAKKITEEKLERLPQFQDKVELKILEPDDKTLPWPDHSFDFILSNQTIYFLFSEEKILRLLQEFKRILKPGGRLLVSMVSRFNMACTKGREVGRDLYEYAYADMPAGQPNRVYVVRDEGHARELFSMFKIHEIGHFDNYYCGVAGHHYVVLASNE